VFNLLSSYIIAAIVFGPGTAHLGGRSWATADTAPGMHVAEFMALHPIAFVAPLVRGLPRSIPKFAEPEQSVSALNEQPLVVQPIADRTVRVQASKVSFAIHRGVPSPVRQARGRVVLSESPGGFFQPVDVRSEAAVVSKIFWPGYFTQTPSVIAAVELEKDTPKPVQDEQSLRHKTVSTFALLALIMLAALFVIARRSSQTVAEQKHALTERVDALSQLLAQNEELQRRVIESNRRSAEINDRFVRRIGAELHDGPVQLIALSLLRLEALRRPDHSMDQIAATGDIDAVESALRDALKEIRDLCSGLALPKLDGVSVGRAIEYAIMNHERRSRTKVTRKLADNLSLKTTPLLLTCAYRFTQEGLNNAVRHAGGKEQSVLAQLSGDELRIEVADGGPGFTETIETTELIGLGLSGLRDRIESLGGVLQIQPREPQGTRLIAIFKLNEFSGSAEHAIGNEAS
jgi:signal transduction histidine kinase